MRETREDLLAAVDGLARVHPDERGAYVRGLLTDMVNAAVPDRVAVGSPMVVRLKAELRQRLAAMVEDNHRGAITPADARDVMGDMVDTLLSGPSVQAGAGIAIDRTTPGVIVISTSGGGGTPVPPVYPTLRFGTSNNGTPDTDELGIVGVNGQGTIPAYAGNMRLLVARLASEGPIRTVLFSDDASRTNQMGAFTEWPLPVVPDGETEPYGVWVSNQALVQPDPLTLTVS